MRGNRLFKIIDRYIGVPLVYLLSLCVKFKGIFGREKRGEAKNILIIKLSAMGDTILLYPAVKGIRQSYPGARISVVCSDVNSEVWGRNENVDEIIKLDVNKAVNPFYLAGFAAGIRRRKFDISADFDQWLRISVLIGLLSEAPVRVGFATKGQYRHTGFTRSLEHSPEIHETDLFIDLARMAGAQVTDRSLFFPVYDNEATSAERILAAECPDCRIKGYAVVHPGCGPHGWQREWPAERYAEICDFITDRYRYKIVLTGGLDEAETVVQVASRLKEEPVNIQGAVSLGELAAVIKNAKFVISGNTGVMHLAAALNTRCIAIHGPTDWKKWGPVGQGHKVITSGLPCSPCLYLGHEYGCSTRKCMENIPAGEVEKAVMEVSGAG
ncbi:MAG: glycosyltransferase family 9 protein [Elusimicrobia bacterium]|nr:glycosyltransferase family 9 protein [Elusimicrobiota bacterium]